MTEYWTKSGRGDMSLPAIWLIYDMSPIHVLVAAKRRSILHLLVRFCAVCGGGFAMTGERTAATFTCATRLLLSFKGVSERDVPVRRPAAYKPFSSQLRRIPLLGEC